MAHRGGGLKDEENTLKAIAASLRLSPDLVELDIRRTTDGVLYCHHGNLLDLLWTARLQQPAAVLKNRLPSFTTLRDAARLIRDQSTLFLHIRDRTITARELIAALEGIPVRPVWVAASSVGYLARLTDLPARWLKVLNVGAWCPRLRVRALRAAGISIAELYLWDFTRPTVRRLRHVGIDAALSRFLLPRTAYLQKARRLSAAWVTDDDLAALNATLRQEMASSKPDRTRTVTATTGDNKRTPGP